MLRSLGGAVQPKVSGALEPPILNASPQQDLGEHRREQDEQIQD
jgi:hypothetical protein